MLSVCILRCAIKNDCILDFARSLFSAGSKEGEDSRQCVCG